MQTDALMQETVLAVLEGTAWAESSLDQGIWECCAAVVLFGPEDGKGTGQVQPLIQEICDSWEEGKEQHAATISFQTQADPDGVNWKPRVTMSETGKQID